MKVRTDLLCLTLAMAFFAVYPQLDLSVSNWFYSAEEGFFLRDQWWVLLIYRGTELAVGALALCLLGILLAAATQSSEWARRNAKAAGFLFMALLLGPGLVVNGAFKSHWGRAKPATVEAFGGDRHYTAPLVPSDQCSRNCSFVSGHASIGFALFGFYWLQRQRHRAWLTAALGGGALVGFVRIVQGGHFLSDVIFSGLAVWYSIRALDAVWHNGTALRARVARYALSQWPDPGATLQRWAEHGRAATKAEG